MTEGIIPRYKLLICYDIIEKTHSDYYQFVFTDLVPAMQSIGLYMLQVYHTAYGNYPLRQLEFVAENWDTVEHAFTTETWQDIKDKFEQFTCNYSQKVLVYRDSFQW